MSVSVYFILGMGEIGERGWVCLSFLKSPLIRNQVLSCDGILKGVGFDLVDQKRRKSFNLT